MAAPSGPVLLPRTDMGGIPEEGTLHHGIASWDTAGTGSVFIVPRGVTRLLIDVQGGWALGGTDGVSIYAPMAGARVLHWVDVAPGSTITVTVGAAGSNAASGSDSVITGSTFTLTAGGGAPAQLGNTSAAPAAGSMRTTSGGNVLAQGSGVGYCVIQW